MSPPSRPEDRWWRRSRQSLTRRTGSGLGDRSTGESDPRATHSGNRSPQHASRHGPCLWDAALRLRVSTRSPWPLPIPALRTCVHTSQCVSATRPVEATKPVVRSAPMCGHALRDEISRGCERTAPAAPAPSTAKAPTAAPRGRDYAKGSNPRRTHGRRG
jgi:hypothetical protein